jgi:hypothetical protein
MGIQGVPARIKPAPKASCRRCGRPVAVLKSGRCSYCGVVLDPSRPVPAVPEHPEALIALDPTARATTSSGSVWLRRLIALGGVSLLTALFARACMKS